ncbi:MAG: hypothetical protein MI924_11920, partial [Chloroflexales bacterium]|nr:hypothetical protein [Chloroflexales bacterium]
MRRRRESGRFVKRPLSRLFAVVLLAMVYCLSVLIVYLKVCLGYDRALKRLHLGGRCFSKKLSEKPFDPARTGSQTGKERSIGTSTCGMRKPCLRAAAWLPHSIPLFRQPL